MIYAAATALTRFDVGDADMLRVQLTTFWEAV